jgi:DNA polymerase-4
MFGNSWKDRVEGFIDKPDECLPPASAKPGERKSPQRVLHVDMDAFFAALEENKNPHLRGKPIVVGGSPTGRGVVSTASYATRQFGIHSGMSAAEALRLCPHAVFVGSELQQYTYVSAELINIYHTFSPKVETTSVDEAFLDITGCGHLFGSEEGLGQALKNTIHEKLGLTCSVGIASTKVMAKLASSVFKPDGLTVLDRQGIEQFVYPLPVDKLWGIGPATLKVLEEMGIHTIEDLATFPLEKLQQRFGKCGYALGKIARGEEDSAVLGAHELPLDKSMSHERTLSRDVADPDIQKATLHYLSDKVARRMRRHKYEGRTITLKLRWADFTTITRAISFSHYTDDTMFIYKIVRGIWISAVRGTHKKVRLLGVAVSHLRHTTTQPQLGLFDARAGRKFKPTDPTVDQLRNKFGESVILRAYSHLGGE